jgi:small subunit ribosomal protein S2
VAIVQVKDLIEAGVHFGHRASRWNPKMRPYIYGKRNLIHIIDLRETVRGLLRAHRFLAQSVAKGNLVLFVGTKRQAKEIVEREAARCGMPYVNERWLGGTLTNYRTIRDRLKRLQELEQLWLAPGERHDKIDLNAHMRGMLNDSGKFDLTKAPPKAEIHRYSKKMVATLNRELSKIRRNLLGIRDMNRLPDALIVIDPHREHIAVKEAQRMGITTVALIDTDSDPDVVDLPIPGNDDSIRSIELVLGRLADASLEGRAALPPEQQQAQMRPRTPPPPSGPSSQGNGPNTQGPKPGPPNPKPASAVVE